ncbi:MAG TPA: hypothetical protein VHT72_05430 [Puia sp.]|nr:hypothetical protein [Puia sp.]
METGVVSAVVHILGVMAVFFSFLPLILYWYKGLAENKAYMIISIFWMINAIIYAPEIFQWQWYVPVDEQITKYYNLFDAPLILLIFYYAFEKRTFLFILLSFIVFEAAVIQITGFNMTSNDIIIGVGSLLCLGLNCWGINKYFRQISYTASDKAYMFIFAGFIFYYGLCVDLIYIFKFFHFSKSQKLYEALVNYTAMVLSTCLISYGFCKYARPDYDQTQIIKSKSRDTFF